MRGADDAVLAAHLRRLDRSDCAALVADLWAERGYDTTREGALVLARADGAERVLYVTGGRSLGAAVRAATSGPDRDVDAVVAPGGGRAAARLAERTGARLLDADDLGELLRYAVAAPAARALCRRHLGAPPADLRPPPGTRLRTAASRVGAARPSAPTVALVAVLVGAAVLGGAWNGPPIDWPGGQSVARDGIPAPGAADTPTATQAAVPVPGVGPDGMHNLTALAAAHERALEGRSHTIWIDVVRPRGGNPGATRVHRDVDVRVAGDRYLVEISRETGESDERGLATRYHDGTATFVADGTGPGVDHRRASAIENDRPAVVDPIALRRTLVTRYLASPETAVTARFTQGGRVQFRIVARGAPPAFEGTTEYTAAAIVTARGFVRELVVEYAVATDGGTYTRRVELTYDRVGRTVVEPPDWYARFSGNGTATGGSSAVDAGARLSGA